MSFPYIQRKRVLIISDSVTRLAELRSLLKRSELEVVGVVGLTEAFSHEQTSFDYVIVDLNANWLPTVLSTLRQQPGTQMASLLIEASRVAGKDLPPGLLPSSRAMVCSRYEIQRLICRPKLISARERVSRALL